MMNWLRWQTSRVTNITKLVGRRGIRWISLLQKTIESSNFQWTKLSSKLMNHYQGNRARSNRNHSGSLSPRIWAVRWIIRRFRIRTLSGTEKMIKQEVVQSHQTLQWTSSASKTKSRMLKKCPRKSILCAFVDEKSRIRNDHATLPNWMKCVNEKLLNT